MYVDSELKSVLDLVKREHSYSWVTTSSLEPREFDKELKYWIGGKKKRKNRRFGLRAQKATTSLKTENGRKHLKSSLRS